MNTGFNYGDNSTCIRTDTMPKNEAQIESNRARFEERLAWVSNFRKKNSKTTRNSNQIFDYREHNVSQNEDNFYFEVKQQKKRNRNSNEASEEWCRITVFD